MITYIGIMFQGWSDKVYHYKTNETFEIGDKAVVIDPNNQYQVVTVTHLDCEVRGDINYKSIYGKVVAL